MSMLTLVHRQVASARDADQERIPYWECCLYLFLSNIRKYSQLQGTYVRKVHTQIIKIT